MRKGFLVFALLAAAAVIAGLALRRGSSAPPTAAGGAPSTAATAAHDVQRLLGRWARTDGSYTIEILGAARDGTVEARYLNPRPIRISRAEARTEAGRLTLFVELNDTGYPGNYYVLAYDPAADALFGVYHHLGIQQRFDVTFNRLEGGPL